jgi:hypothetical protein
MIPLAFQALRALSTVVPFNKQGRERKSIQGILLGMTAKCVTQDELFCLHRVDKGQDIPPELREELLRRGLIWSESERTQLTPEGWAILSKNSDSL